MEPSGTLPPAFVASSLAAAAFEILFPLVVALFVQRRLGVGWRYFGYGALVFLVSQILTRLPAVQVIQAALAPQLQASTAVRWAWLVALALTAGLFEEIGRYLGYRWLMRREEKTWSRGVMFGLGHGGLESMVLVAGLTLLTLVGLMNLAAAGVAPPLPPEQRARAAEQLAAVQAQSPFVPLVAIWERAWALGLQVGFSIVVLQVFQRRRLIWLLWAILAHAFVDLTAVSIPQVLGPGAPAIVLAEGLVGVYGAIALWVTWRLRAPPVQPRVRVVPPARLGRRSV